MLCFVSGHMNNAVSYRGTMGDVVFHALRAQFAIKCYMQMTTYKGMIKNPPAHAVFFSSNHPLYFIQSNIFKLYCFTDRYAFYLLQYPHAYVTKGKKVYKYIHLHKSYQ